MMISAISRKFLLRRLFGEVYVGKRLKMRYFNRLIPSLTRELGTQPRILEVGSEDGCFTEWLSRQWPQGVVEGMELRESWAGACAEWARAAGRSPQLTFRQGDVQEMEEEDQYDLIVCFDVLGYVKNDADAVRRMKRALRPSGMLLIHQPNPYYRSFNGRVQYVPPEQASEITEGHVRHGYTPQEILSLLSSCGLHVARVHELHGRYSDLAHRVYHRLESPAPLRLLSLPFTDVLWLLDWLLPTPHGNTVLACAANAGAALKDEVKLSA